MVQGLRVSKALVFFLLTSRNGISKMQRKTFLLNKNKQSHFLSITQFLNVAHGFHCQKNRNQGRHCVFFLSIISTVYICWNLHCLNFFFHLHEWLPVLLCVHACVYYLNRILRKIKKLQTHRKKKKIKRMGKSEGHQKAKKKRKKRYLRKPFLTSFLALIKLIVSICTLANSIF